MLFEYLFLLKDYDASFLTSANGSIRKFIIPVSRELLDKKSELFLELHHTKQHFCFFFTGGWVRFSDEFVKEEMIQHLTRLLFLPNYIRLSGKYLFFFERVKEEDKSIDPLKDHIIKELARQGIKDIVFEMIDTDVPTEDLVGENVIAVIHPQLNNYLINGTVGVNYELFVKKFNLLTYFNKKLVVTVETPDDLQHKIMLIEHLENWIKLTEPLKVKLVEKYMLAEMEGMALRTENELLKIKLQNSSTYLRELRQQAQWQVTNQTGNDGIPPEFLPVNDPDGLILQLQARIAAEKKHSQTILEWYKKEYEVLPMWYQRFGHIIKVIMGKRTFKSLFK